MKRILIIPGAFFALLLFSAKSCDEEPGPDRVAVEKEIAAAFDSVKDLFKTDYLDEESLFVFTENAKQKLCDYSDYRNLASDTSLETAFREQALTLMAELFSPQTEPPPLDPGTKIRLDSIWLIESLHMTGEETYNGLLGFSEEITRGPGQKTITTGSREKQVGFMALKSTRIFGTDTVRIWKVYLGRIQ